jgi:membrane protease YdiL (CAAX protease family)
MALIILDNFVTLPSGKVTAALLLWSSLGAVGVGFGEEMITRGSMVVGLRSRFSEGRVWLISTLLFSALHVPNVLYGLPLSSMPIQVVLTFIMGSGLYAIRRMSGTLILPMVLHGLWDSSLFLTVATGAEPSPVQFAVYPLAIVCVVAVLRKSKNV